LSRPGLEGWLLIALPWLALGTMLGALTLLPVFPLSQGFGGDVILFVALLELSTVCTVLAGFASRSLFGQVGATREALLSVAYNLPFLTALAALATAAHSLRLADFVLTPSAGARVLPVLALLLCLPIKLRLNPFSLSNAEQEIYTGPTTELGGLQLALWELVHGLEWVVLTGLVASLALPGPAAWVPVRAALFVILSLVAVLALAGLAAGTARLKVPQATRFYWGWGWGIAVLALIIAVLPIWRATP